MTQVDGPLQDEGLNDRLDLVYVVEHPPPVLPEVQRVGGDLHHAPIYSPVNSSSTCTRSLPIQAATCFACSTRT